MYSLLIDTYIKVFQMCGMVLLLGNASKYMYDCISGVHHQEREEKERLFNAVETVSWIALVFILEVRLLSLLGCADHLFAFILH